jgi:hypothetical protein
MSKNSVNEVTDKTGEPIEVGDTVTTRMRGGKRTGEVRTYIACEFCYNVSPVLELRNQLNR